jgi:plasmid stabilization system protein ParE
VTRIVWTLQAIEDVEAIQSYIARDSPNYAALLAERIVESVDASPASRARTGCMPSSC